jgi:hypothetical protein
MQDTTLPTTVQANSARTHHVLFWCNAYIVVGLVVLLLVFLFGRKLRKPPESGLSARTDHSLPALILSALSIAPQPFGIVVAIALWPVLAFLLWRFLRDE